MSLKPFANLGSLLRSERSTRQSESDPQKMRANDVLGLVVLLLQYRTTRGECDW